MTKLFGVDIGTSSIKVVEANRDKNGFQLIASGEIPAPLHNVLSESDVDHELIASTIRKLVESSKINTKMVNAALPENQVFTRLIEMPSLTDKELASAIRWEAEQYVPLPAEQVSLDWEVQHQDKEKNRMEVLLIGAPTNLISKYQKILSLAGLEIVVLETELVAASRVLIDETSVPTLVVDIGANTTDMGIVESEGIFGTYSLPTGGNALSRAISTEFNLDINQAEEYKKTYGLSNEAFEGKISLALKPILDSLIAELKKAMSFYQSKSQNRGEIKRIILSGGGAKLVNLPVFLTNSLNLEIEIANPWKRFSSPPPQKLQEEAPLFSIAVGLAIREL